MGTSNNLIPNSAGQRSGNSVVDVWDQFPDAPLSQAANFDPWDQFPDADVPADSTQIALARQLPPIAQTGFGTLLDEKSAKAYIDSLPANQQDTARRQWADVDVASNRAANPTPYADAENRIARNVPGVGSFNDEGNAALAATGGHDYDMSLAYNRANDRAVDATPTDKLGHLPVIGDVYSSGVQKAIGAVGGAALPVAPAAEVLGFGTGLIPGAIDGALNAGAYGALQGFGAGEGVSDRLSKTGTEGGYGVAGGAVLGGVGGKIARQFEPAAQTPGREAVDAAARLDTGVTLPNGQNETVGIPKFLASDSRLVRGAAGNLAGAPLTGGMIRAPLEKSSQELGQAADVLAGKASLQGLASGAPDASAAANIAGGLTKQSFNNWIKGTSAKQLNDAYDDIDQYVRPGALTPLTNTTKMAQQLLAEDYKNASTVNHAAIQPVMDAITRPGGLTYDGIKGLRTNVGAMVDDWTLPNAGTTNPGLKRIYGALTDDLKSSVQASAKRGMAPQALQAFNDANALAQKVSTQRESLTKIMGGDGDAPGEQVINRIISMASNKSNADENTLLNARQAAGTPTWSEVRSAVIQSMGRGGGQNPGLPGQAPSDAFSPDRFVTAWDKMSKNGKDAVFGDNIPQSLRSGLEDLATVSRRFKDLRQFQNPSGTGMTAGLTAMGGRIAYGVASANPAMFFTPILQVAGQAVASKLLSRPASVRAVSRYGNAIHNAITGRGGQAAYNFAVTNLAKEIASLNGQDPSDVGRRLNASLASAE